jgi:hypothetical protein
MSGKLFFNRRYFWLLRVIRPWSRGIFHAIAMVHERLATFFPIAVDHATVIVPFLNDICRDGS